MKLKIEERDLTLYKSRDNIPLECEFCKKTFFRPKNLILRGLKGTKSVSFCDIECRRKAQVSKKEVECKNCGTLFHKARARIIKSPNHFCSHSCNALYMNAHKSFGSRRSKLEIWLEKMILERFPLIPVLFNSKDAINSELDIYIPSLKLAFELNGIFHYEPIYGPEKLASIKNNDSRKFQACLEKGIELCIIDSSSEVRFKEEKSKKYLDIVINLIDKKSGGCSP
jgi:hypothetical protein